MSRSTRRGFNLIEVTVAIGTAAIVLLALGSFIGATYKSAGSERDRTFAMQRAMQMMDEIATYRETSTISQFDEATNTYSFALTTKSTAVAHGELSGNPKLNGNYKYVRHIDVENVIGDDTAKKVTVSVYYAKKGATPDKKTTNEKPLAVVSNILRIASGGSGSTQVYDVYVISIENIPHIYRKSDADDTTRKTYFPSATEARLAFEQAVRTFTSQTPGLELRTHYITRLSQGRDTTYRPYVNSSLGVDNDDQKWVYFYPGKLKNAADAPRYFDLQAMNGRRWEGDSSSNPAAPATSTASYNFADQFNHAVMYGGEHAYAQTARSAAVTPPGAPSTDTMSPLSLRQFLDDMLTDTTGKYRNAIIVNLHGEMFPALPLRNYADAAKDPEDSDSTMRRRRIVTHPYKLNTALGTGDTVRLLVHPFLEGGGDTPAETDKRKHVTADISAYAKNARIWIRDLKPRLEGGTLSDVKVFMVQRERDDGQTHISSLVYSDLGGTDKAYYNYVQAWPLTDAATDEDDADRLMHSGPHLGRSQLVTTHVPLPVGSGVQWDPDHTDDLMIDLCDLDYDAHATDVGGDKWGLGSDASKFRLYGLQYFPDPWLTMLDEANEHKHVRNTARVVIEFQLKSSTGLGRYEVVTALRPSDFDSTEWANLEREDVEYPWATKTWFYGGYTYNADMGLYWDATNWRPSIPWSDQVQLVGDPRHNPLEDVRRYHLANPYWTDWTNNKDLYNEVNNQGKKIDAANDWATVPETSTGSPGNGKSKKPKKPKKVGANLAFPRSADSWNGVKYNAPMYFRMWREALYRNSAMLVNAGGQPLGYLGLGGEFCLEGEIDDLPSVQTKQALYTGTTGSGNGKDELKDLVPMIVHDNGTADWIAKPWIGELFPSGYFDGTARWESKGNLSTGVSSGDDFKRVNLEHSEVAALWDSYANREDAHNRKLINGGHGLSGLLYNSATSGAMTVQQSTETVSVPTGPGTAWEDLLQARFQLLNSRWPYKLSGADVPEGSTYPATYVEATDWLNGASNAYVQRDGTHAAARPIVQTGRTISGTPADRAWIFYANAFRPETTFDMSRIFENAVFGMVAAYHDGIRNSLKAGAMRPMPRVEITAPLHAGTVTGNTVTINVGRSWARADKGAYTPNATYNATQSVAQGGPDDTIYVVKYRNLTNGTWRLAQLTTPVTVTDQTAVPGDLPPSGVNVIAPSRSATTFTASWTLPNATIMPDGEYLLRVEGFRLDQASTPNRVPNHQAYHEVKFILDR